MDRVGSVARRDAVAAWALRMRNLKRVNWAARRRVSSSSGSSGLGSGMSQYLRMGRVVDGAAGGSRWSSMSILSSSSSVVVVGFEFWVALVSNNGEGG